MSHREKSAILLRPQNESLQTPAQSLDVAHSTAGPRPRFRIRRATAVPPVRRAERGATLVEFALICMVFLAMVFGIIEFSRALYSYHFLSNMARDATRWAAVNGSTCGNDSSCDGAEGMNNGPATAADIENYVKGHVPMGINPAEITAIALWPKSGATLPSACSTNPTAQGCNCYSSSIGSDNTDANSPGCTVEVTVKYQFHFLFPFIHNSPITLSSSSEMIILH
jgi:Flp pilus assembly pilin Flp